MTKVTSQVDILNDIRSMKMPLDKLAAWPNRWDMEFAVNKCGVMHIGKRNLDLVSNE